MNVPLKVKHVSTWLPHPAEEEQVALGTTTLLPHTISCSLYTLGTFFMPGLPSQLLEIQ